ncbi:T-lymphocyte activation antigen CD86 isoform X7 [Papio anubis]|uniref:T-lymphocyte activation antigen CD86 isoform X7 n=1 Tax=Papio anubis TaxID=9555 RepID=UPI0004F1FB94|nr:T-lymphocyte activation antigen CD86 isoform X7 [Papio anubis]
MPTCRQKLFGTKQEHCPWLWCCFSSQFPFLYLSSTVSPDIISLSARSLRRYGELAKTPFVFFLLPCFCVPWECCCAYASGLFLERQWTGICDSTMGLSNTLFVMAFLLSANFSQPEIVPISNITENMYINLTCSSIHGYPEPEKMSVLLRTKNSTIEYDGVMQKSQDNVTELYDVSISLSVSFPDVTSNMTIFCVLETDKTQLLSSPFSIELEDPQPPPDHIPWITAVLPTVIICVMAFCLILWKWKKKKQPRNSYKCGTNTMEREESEQTKKREKINVPERSDEAQCVFKSLKTPSCDKSDTHF